MADEDTITQDTVDSGDTQDTPQDNPQDTPQDSGDTRTVLTSDSDGRASPTIWPEDWRDQMIGDDLDSRKRMDRFASPLDVWHSYRELEKRVSSGNLKESAPGDDNPEALKAWREQNGVPVEVDGYFEKLGDLELGDDDRERAKSFLEVAHQHNAPPELAKAAIEWSFQQQEALAAEQLDRDRTVQQEAEDVLRKEWGDSYRTNVQDIVNLLDRVPEGPDPENPIKEQLMSARLPDGTPVMSNPQVLRFLLSMKREIDPVPSLVSGSAQDPMGNIDARITEIERVMRTDRARYNKELSGEYADLLAAREKLRERQRA